MKMCCKNVQNWDFLFSRHENSWLLPCCNNHNCFLVDFCLRRLVDDARSNTSNSHAVHKCTNAIARITTILSDEHHSIDELYETEILHIVLQFIDFVLDVVCHSCVSIFHNLLLLHALRCGGCAASGDRSTCAWIREICVVLSDRNALSSFRLRALSRLVEFVGVGRRLLSDEFFAVLYNQIGNSSLSNVISTLITDDLCFLPERSSLHIHSIKHCLEHSSAAIRCATKQRLLLFVLKVPRLRTWFMENFFELSDLPRKSPYFLESKLALTKFAVLHQKTISMSQGWEDFMSASTLLAALLCNNVEIKLTAWNLMCDHPKKARPFSVVELDFAKCFVACNMVEQTPQIRQKVFSGLEKLCERLRNSTVRLFKECLQSTESENKLESCREFLRYLNRLAFHSLGQKSANFNRRLSALLLVKILFCGDSLQSKDVDLRLRFEMSSWLDENCVQLLLSCLDNEFQLCQDAALEILTNLNLEALNFDFSPFLDEAKGSLFPQNSNFHRGPSNIRLRFLCLKFGDQSAIILNEILIKCEWILDEIGANGESSIIRFCDDSMCPYTLLFAVEDILWAVFAGSESKSKKKSDNLAEVHVDSKMASLILERLIPICFKFAQIVSPICHSLSPEGFLPPEFFDSLQNGSTDIDSLAKMHINVAQKLLVSCWRTHKCVSSIFSLLFPRSPYPQFLTQNILHEIGDYLWLQLTECRHCGAFESAAEAFEALCSRMWEISRQCSQNGESVENSPNKWLRKALDALSGENDIDNLCITRRSAGLPHLILVILVTGRIGKKFPHLSETLDQLLKCRQLKPKLEIHCVNVLKALFANSALAEGVLAHVEAAFCVCFAGCAASEWPIRNAHCQFFSALVQRVFGSPKSAQRSLHEENSTKMTSFTLFSRYPSLYPILIERLGSASLNSNKRSEFGAFPMLILLTHLHQSAIDLETTQFPLCNFLPGLLALLFSSPIEKLRELAAAAVISITSTAELARILNFALSQLDSSEKLPKQNFVDGILILLTFMVELDIFNAPNHECLLELSRSLLERFFALIDWSRQMSSDFTLSATLALIHQIGTAGLKRRVICAFCALIEDVRGGKIDYSIFFAWHCALRPIGALFAEFHSEFWSRISKGSDSEKVGKIDAVLSEVRYESYREFCVTDRKFELNASEDGMRLIFKDLLFDLKNCDRERHLEFICALLLRESRKLFELELGIDFKNILRAESFCQSAKNRLNLIRLKYLQIGNNNELTDAFSVEDLSRFITQTLTRSDEENIRLAALKLAEELIERFHGLRFVEEASIALKDESADVRNYAAHILSNQLFPGESNDSSSMVGDFADAPLNAEICWSLALERFPNLPECLNSSDSDNNSRHLAGSTQPKSKRESQIFEASVQNIFAEDFGIFEFEKFKEIFALFQTEEI